LATNALLREIANLEEKLSYRIEGVVETFRERLAGIDRATEVFNADLKRVPTELDRAMSSSRTLTEEQFKRVETRLDGMAKLKHEQFEGIQKQFQERDIRAQHQIESAQKALDAALNAAKEAASKSEANQVKSIEQLGELVNSVTGALRDQLEELRSRTTRIEAIAIGQSTQKVEQHGSSSLVISVIGVGITILLALMAVYAFISRIPAGR
jgi:hypothetical protein